MYLFEIFKENIMQKWIDFCEAKRIACSLKWLRNAEIKWRKITGKLRNLDIQTISFIFSYKTIFCKRPKSSNIRRNNWPLTSCQEIIIYVWKEKFSQKKFQ